MTTPCFTSSAAIESTSWEWYCDALAKATVLAACKKQSNQPTTPELDTKAIYRDAYARLWNEQLALQSA